MALVMDCGGKTRHVVVPTDAKGGEIRAALARDIKFPEAMLRITYRGCELRLDQTATEAGISHGTKLAVAVGLAGGAVEAVRRRSEEPGTWKNAAAALVRSQANEVVLSEGAKGRIEQITGTVLQEWDGQWSTEAQREVLDVELRADSDSELTAVPACTGQDTMAEALSTALLGCPSGWREIGRVLLLANVKAGAGHCAAAGSEGTWGPQHARLVGIAMGTNVDIIKPDGSVWCASVYDEYSEGTAEGNGERHTHYIQELDDGTYAAALTTRGTAGLNALETAGRRRIWQWARAQRDKEGCLLGSAAVTALVKRELATARKAEQERVARNEAHIQKAKWAKPIVVRPQRSKQTVRVAGWNIYRQFQPEAIASYMVANGVTHLSISEHGVNTKRKRTLGWANAKLAEYGLRATWTAQQAVVYDESVWHGCATAGHAWKPQCNGRLMGQLYQTASPDADDCGGEYFGVISCYGVSGTGESDELEGSTRGAVRRELTTLTCKVMREMEATAPGCKIIVIGDLNDTLSTSPLECVGSMPRGPHHNGLAAMLVGTGWQSAVRKTWPKDTVVSHYTHAGARLIDHCMVNSAAELALRFAAIDTKGAEEYSTSDHDPVIADFEITTQTSRATAGANLALKYEFRKVVEMPLKESEEEGAQEFEFVLDDKKAKEHHIDRWATMRAAAEDPDVLAFVAEAEKEASSCMQMLAKAGASSAMPCARTRAMREAINRAACALENATRKTFELAHWVQEPDAVASRIQSRRRALLAAGLIPDPEMLRGTEASKQIVVGLAAWKEAQRALRRAERAAEHGKEAGAAADAMVRERGRAATAGDTAIRATMAAVTAREEEYKTMAEESNDMEEARGRPLDAYKGGWPTALGDVLISERADNKATMDSVLARVDGAMTAEERLKRETPEEAGGRMADWIVPEGETNAQTDADGRIEWIRTALKRCTAGLQRLQRLQADMARKRRTHQALTSDTSAFATSTQSGDERRQRVVRQAPEAEFTYQVEEVDGNGTVTSRTVPATSVAEQWHGVDQIQKPWMGHPPGARCLFAVPTTAEGGDRNEVDYFEFKHLNGRADVSAYLGRAPESEAERMVIEEAHDDMADVLEPPTKDAAEMSWPYWVDAQGQFSDPSIKDNWGKDVTKGPGKARHDQTSIAVLGRLGPAFVRTGLVLAQAQLASRIVADIHQACTRVLIPKGGGGCRPITLMADQTAWLHAQVQTAWDKGMEASGIYPEELYSFRQGRSTSQVLAQHISILEDAEQSGQPLACIVDDFAKMYCRVTADSASLCMRALGIPGNSYATWLVESYRNRAVRIQTKAGQRAGTQECGFAQGSPFSY